MDEHLIMEAIEYIRELFSGDAGGHDAGHSLRVYRLALRIAQGEPGADLTVVALAALLHDADDHKLFRTEHNANARGFLASHGLPPETIERICRCINAVSFSQNRGKRPDSIEGKIVQDADRLDALGAVGIARTFAYGGAHGRTMESSVAHFHEKLLLLRDELNTETAKRLAQPRHELLLRFLEEYEAETKE